MANQANMHYIQALEKYERGPMSNHAVSLWNFKGNAQDKCKSEHNHRC